MKQLVFEHIHSQGIYSSENSVSVIEKLFDVVRPLIIVMQFAVNFVFKTFLTNDRI